VKITTKGLRVRSHHTNTLSFLSFGFLAYSFLILLAFSTTAAVPPLRILDADGEEIALFPIQEKDEGKYVALEAVSRLFGGTMTSKPLIKQTIVNIMGKRIVFAIDKKRVEVNNKEFELLYPTASISGKVYIPLDFLTHILPNITGKKIELDQANWTLRLTREPFADVDSQNKDIETMPVPTSGEFRVILDPGHGGYDMGARSKTGFLEKDLTYTVAQRIKSILSEKESGITAYLTRGENDYLSPEERINLANKLHGDLYLSIHFNWSPIKQSRGFRLYVNSYRMRLGHGADLGADIFSRSRQTEDELSNVKQFLPQSRELAREIIDGLKSIGLTGEQEKEVFIAAMDNLSMPGVLVEVLYLSSDQDLKILSMPDFIDSLSQSFCNSLLAFRAELEDEPGALSAK
jgi:N-acetylmuramoyl-L-alanine amidase